MMKKANLVSLLLLITGSIATTNNAYEFSFFNNTNDPIGIAIQYTRNSNDEPLYKQLIKPREMFTFTPGKIKIPEIKWGFCLDNIYYIKNPTTEQRVRNFEKTNWRKVPVTWIEERSATKRKAKKRHPLEQTTISTATSAQKSLCRDRHFDIIENEHGAVSITSSLNE